MAKMQASSSHVPWDLGPFLEVPAVGAGGSRVFKVGPRGALMIDAGSDPRGGVTAAVYLNQLEGVMRNLGVTHMEKVQIIHVHRDHISSIPQVLQQYGVTPDRLSIPREFTQVREMQRVLTELRKQPGAAGLGYTATWVPRTVSKDRSGGRGDIFRYSYKAGEASVEHVGLKSAFRAMTDLDRSSYLTRVTRPADRASVVILGDMRGSDLAAIRSAMEGQRVGSWAEFFQGMTTLSGFSHHVGRMDAGHVAGMMSLLEVTLLRNGTLRVVEQTNPDDHSTTRAETMELMSRLGIELVTAEMPTAGAVPSGAGASGDRLTVRGPNAQARAITPSALTDGLARIERLAQARSTLDVWRPFFEELDPSAKKYFDTELLPQIEQSLQHLRAAVRTAMEAALRVRTEGRKAEGGTGRDYTANGGRRGTAFVTALSAIPRTTQAETTLGPKGLEALEKCRQMGPRQVPLQVAVHAALTRGEYSDKAFAHMLSALEPTTRNSLLTGRRGGPTTRLKAFQRVRVQFAFQQAVLGTGELSIPRHWSSGARATTRGGAGFFALLEIINSVVEPIVEGIRTEKRIFAGSNLLPFVRRFLLWRQMGVAPRLVGVDDGLLEVREERDPVKVVEGLNEGLWDALYFEKPGISDADVIVFGAWMTQYIRNLDEFFSFFMDSYQDALSWDGGEVDWTKATWKVKVGRYEYSGQNHVVESWYTHPKLTQLMQVFTGGLIANTNLLLDELGREGKISDETFSRIGSLNELNLLPPPRGRARLKSGLTKMSPQPMPVELYTTGHQPERQQRKVQWTNTLPQFYVYPDIMRSDGDYVLVGGADFNTYAALRALPNEHRVLNMGFIAGEVRNYVTSQKTRNASAMVYIRRSLLELENTSP
ncbi:hypothetical protein [Corallococcus exiguus]|uniref:hypothetical protein n=1 Tax=Corallococcus exiguus TaxID=83462 RepID=UPI001470E656|nr:hypothetical protein [Corallococcus exiguus]NNB86280.1 hypothetical protein [Corallococcus exiguus]